MKKTRINMVDTVKGFIFALTLLEVPVFFAIYALMGWTYGGSETTPSYVVYLVILLVLQVFLLIKKGRLRKSEFLWLMIPLLYIIVAWFFAALDYNEININNIRLIILWQYTGILLAINVSSYDIDISIVKSLVFLMFILTIGSVLTVLLPYLRGRNIYEVAGYSLTGSSFQAQSYYIALASGINLFFFASSLKSRLSKICTYILLGVQFFCAILYAGRGGAILSIAYVISYYLYKNRQTDNFSNKLFMTLLYLLGLVILFISLGYFIDANPELQRRFARLFSYIGSEGLDMGQTSNRGTIYSKALDFIVESPIFGYGLLGYLFLPGLNRYPHNIALEMLIEGGIIYLLLWGLIIIMGLKKITRLKSENKYKIFLVMALFAVIKLSFSGSYSYEMLFWFSVVFTHICERRGGRV